jgi:AcrR family transcriptional regulator
MALVEDPKPRRLLTTVGGIPEAATSDGTRGRILAVALHLFAESGYSGTSIREIAAAAQLQSASLYAHYPSKEHILAELIVIGHEEHHQRLRSALLESQPEPAEQLAALVRAHVRVHCEYSMLTVVANNELHALSPKLAAPALATRQRSTDLFEEVITRGVQRGDFGPPHVWMAVAAIGGMGIRVANWYSPEFELSVDEVADAYAEFALRITRRAD